MVEWARLLRSFRKLRLFAASIKALGVIRKVGVHVRALEERIAKGAKWPVPSDHSEVGGCLGNVGVIRRWIKKFAEIARLLSRVSEKVNNVSCVSCYICNVQDNPHTIEADISCCSWAH